MEWVKILFFISLLFGTVVSVTVLPGVTLYLHDFFLVLLLASSVLTKTKQKLQAKLMPFITLFGIVSLLSLLINSNLISLPELGISSLYLIRWLMYAGIYIIVLRKQINATSWLVGLFGVGVGYALIGIIQFFLYPDLRNLMYLGWDPHYYRLFSTILDPNFAGIIFVFTVLLGFYFYVQRKHRLLLSAMLIPIIALVLTFSRSSYLAFAFGLGVFVVLQRQWKYAFTVCALFACIYLFFPNPGQAVTPFFRTATGIARIENWKESLILIKRSPIFGYGFNTLRYVLDKSPADSFVSHAGAGFDNSFLFLLATTGVIGFSAYLWLLVSIVRLTFIITALSNDSRVFTHTVLATLVSVFIHSQFVNSLFFPQVMIWIWILVGVMEVKLREESLKTRRSS